MGNLAEYEFTINQQRFIEEYLKGDVSLREAATRAGYSEKTAASQGSALYNNPKIRKEIERRQEEAAANLGITKQRILSELSKLAFSNIQDLSDVLEGNKSLKDIDRSSAAGIVEFERTQKRIKLKQADKLGALVNLGKELGMFTKSSVDFNVNLSLEELVKASMDNIIEGEVINNEVTLIESDT